EPEEQGRAVVELLAIDRAGVDLHLGAGGQLEVLHPREPHGQPAVLRFGGVAEELEGAVLEDGREIEAAVGVEVGGGQGGRWGRWRREDGGAAVVEVGEDEGGGRGGLGFPAGSLEVLEQGGAGGEGGPAVGVGVESGQGGGARGQGLDRLRLVGAAQMVSINYTRPAFVAHREIE